MTVEEIDALLPQTQCGECGYQGCGPYAEAIFHNMTTLDRCPPGGVPTLTALGVLLQKDVSPYLEQMARVAKAPTKAVIREAECIGCTKCISACPVDAIVGSAKKMHAILTHECTGCGLCVEPCPVDCIDMVATPLTFDKNLARERAKAKQIRLLREAQSSEALYQEKRRLLSNTPDKKIEKQAKKAYILEALARVKAKKNL